MCFFLTFLHVLCDKSNSFEMTWGWVNTFLGKLSFKERPTNVWLLIYKHNQLLVFLNKCKIKSIAKLTPT